MVSSRISIAGSNYPRYELNSHTGDDHYDPKAAVAVNCSLFHGGEQSSTLIVPVLGLAFVLGAAYGLNP